jgi:hypothetical protein
MPPAADCCDVTHDVSIDMGYCRHLKISEENGQRAFECRVYGSADFPDLCAQYNCVAWAKAFNSYNDSNVTLLAAQRAADRVHEAKACG